LVSESTHVNSICFGVSSDPDSFACVMDDFAKKQAVVEMSHFHTCFHSDIMCFMVPFTTLVGD
jgi:hypothetical protein